ncbi:MAG: hypothetical protein GWN79_29185 [Actinobacteria bacterium]|nr:hypothetical protein [Actinomycetota bacterium]NIS37403.1 hypothetical protein [Actinomycetota bacterium]NIT99267.1 hypothetical protein [Actinomycetota bacterium]NIU22865.1 hypothetical protein [Actinomycetota bacterium]NIU71833.1 hypothetical protein [Actinomycetota bacterium]
MRTTVRRLLPVVAALLVLVPLLRAPRNDTYPLSTYPMFATDRGAVHAIATAVEVAKDGSAIRLSPSLIAGTDEVVLASVTVARAVRRGEADALCAEILARVGAGRRIEVRSETIDAVAHVVEGADPYAVTVHARCGAVP